jgi:hypothetical protein
VPVTTTSAPPWSAVTAGSDVCENAGAAKAALTNKVELSRRERVLVSILRVPFVIRFSDRCLAA